LTSQNDKNIENLIKYVLLTAGEEDSFFERSLQTVEKALDESLGL